MKTLLVMRHAKSSWNEEGLADHDRPLNKRGERDAPRMGRFLASEKLRPDIVVSSSAVRAQSTARKVIDGADWDLTPTSSEALYLAGAQEIIAYLSTLPGHVEQALFVGHNPGVTELVAVLTDDYVAMPTCAVAVIQLETKRWRDLSSGDSHQMANYWYPKGLPTDFD